VAPAVDVYIYSDPGSPLGCAEVGDMAGRLVLECGIEASVFWCSGVRTKHVTTRKTILNFSKYFTSYSISIIHTYSAYSLEYYS